jgi:type IV secretory pathway VirB10-like protein
MPEQGPPEQPAKASNASLLAAAPPRATRYRRNLIIALTSGAAIFFAGAFVFGFMHSPGGGPGQNSSTATNQASPDFGQFPNSYADLTKKPTPPKGVLAPTNLPASGQTTQAATTANNGNSTGNGPPQESAAQLAADKAAASALFFSGTTDPDTVTAQAGQGGSGIVQPARLGILPTPGQVPAQGAQNGASADPGGQGDKNSFLSASSTPPTTDYTSTSLQTPISKYEVQAGTTIPAALLTVINSDLPGDVVAQVTENVYDSPTGNYLLIPQGAKLYGKYDSLISYAQTRALVVWNRIIFPNGTSIDLDGMVGTDPTGESGVQDQVNRHIWGLVGAIAAATLLNFGPSLALEATEPSQSNSGSTTNVYTDPAQNLGNSVNNIGQEIVSKELNRPNTITIRSGYPLRVLVNKDLVLQPYTP